MSQCQFELLVPSGTAMIELTNTYRYNWTKRRDPGRPVHYEGDSKAASADMFSYMYPSIAQLDAEAKSDGDEFEKPIVLCEYAHAMGNGPGYVRKTSARRS